MVDLSRSIRGLLDGTVERARKLEATNALVAAADAWEEAARLSLKIADASPSAAEQKSRRAAARQLMEHAVQLRSRRLPANADPSSGDAAAQNGHHDSAHAVRGLRHQSNTRWSQIAGLQDTITAIQSAYALVVAKAPDGVHLRPRNNLLFYGPPGCGKSLLASAASCSLDAPFFNVPVSKLLSKWFGESAQLVSSLYEEARHDPVSVVFLDEVDALGRSRDQQDTQASRQILASLLAELDGVGSKAHSHTVITIAATNAPWDLDPALLSRFSRRILIPLPDREARWQMFEIHLTQRGFALEGSLDALVRDTDGFSGREIEQVCDSLVEKMLWRENPRLASLATEAKTLLADYTVQVGPIRREDVDAVIQQVKPCTSPQMVSRYESWGTRVV